MRDNKRRQTKEEWEEMMDEGGEYYSEFKHNISRLWRKKPVDPEVSEAEKEE